MHYDHSIPFEEYFTYHPVMTDWRKQQHEAIRMMLNQAVTIAEVKQQQIIYNTQKSTG